jgi:type IV secretory pathway component VirB8
MGFPAGATSKRSDLSVRRWQMTMTFSFDSGPLHSSQRSALVFFANAQNATRREYSKSHIAT